MRNIFQYSDLKMVKKFKQIYLLFSLEIKCRKTYKNIEKTIDTFARRCYIKSTNIKEILQYKRINLILKYIDNFIWNAVKDIPEPPQLTCA